MHTEFSSSGHHSMAEDCISSDMPESERNTEHDDMKRLPFGVYRASRESETEGMV